MKLYPLREPFSRRSPDSRLADSALAPRLRGAALCPAASYAFLFWRGECIEEWNGAAGLGRERVKSSRLTAHMGRNDPFRCKYERCLAKPIFKRNGEAQSLCACPPSRRAQIPAVFRRNYKTAGIAPSMKTVPITRM